MSKFNVGDRFKLVNMGPQAVLPNGTFGTVRIVLEEGFRYDSEVEGGWGRAITHDRYMEPVTMEQEFPPRLFSEVRPHLRTPYEQAVIDASAQQHGITAVLPVTKYGWDVKDNQLYSEQSRFQPAPSPVEPARPSVTLMTLEDVLPDFGTSMTISNGLENQTWHNDAAMKTVQADNARLRKKLEAARNEWLPPTGYALIAKDQINTFAAPCDHEATIHRLTLFSEDQARQIERYEIDRAAFTKSAMEDGAIIGRLTRELERAKRAK